MDVCDENAYNSFQHSILNTVERQDTIDWVDKHIIDTAKEGYKYEPLSVVPTNVNEGKVIADISFLNFSQILVLSQKALDVLGYFLEGKGRLLPLDYQGEQNYFVFDVKHVIDALDIDKCYGVDKTEKVFEKGEFSILGVKTHAFHANKVENESIFIIPEFEWADIFVSEDFKQAVENSDLISDICFPAVWDSENPDFIDEIFLRYHPYNWEYLLSIWKSEANNTAQPTTPDVPLLSTDSKPESIESFPEFLREEQAEIIAATLHLYQQQTQNDDFSPPAVVVWLQGYVEALRESGIAGDELRNIGVDMATLWGEQIVQHYGWTWHILDDEYAVVAPDASLYILPIPFMAQFFVDREKDITLALVFNGLSRTDIVRAKAGAYVELR